MSAPLSRFLKKLELYLTTSYICGFGEEFDTFDGIHVTLPDSDYLSCAKCPICSKFADDMNFIKFNKNHRKLKLTSYDIHRLAHDDILEHDIELRDKVIAFFEVTDKPYACETKTITCWQQTSAMERCVKGSNHFKINDRQMKIKLVTIEDENLSSLKFMPSSKPRHPGIYMYELIDIVVPIMWD